MLCSCIALYAMAAQVRGAMMFVEQHEDWEAQGGEVAHVMGQICALVLDRRGPLPFLDSCCHHQQRSSSSGFLAPAGELLAAVDAAAVVPALSLTEMEAAAPALAASVA